MLPACVLQRMRAPDLSALCDVEVIVQGKRFLAHRAVLSAASEVLCVMLSSTWSKATNRSVTLDSITATAFRAILDFIYEGALTVNADTILETRAAAIILLMDDLSTRLRLMIVRGICAETAFDIGAHGLLFDDPELQLESERYICHHFTSVAESPTFLRQPASCIEHFVASDDIILCGDHGTGEIVALNALTRWRDARVPDLTPAARFTIPAGHDPTALPEPQGIDCLSYERQFQSLLSHIRFDDLTYHQLQPLALNSPVPAIAARAYDTIKRRIAHITGLPTTLHEIDADSNTNAQLFHDATQQIAIANAGFSAVTRRRLFTDPRLLSRDPTHKSGGPRFRVGRRTVRTTRFDLIVENALRDERVGKGVIGSWHRGGDGLLWGLDAYPCGSSTEVQDYMSVSLRCTHENRSTFRCVASFSVCILEQDFGNRENSITATQVFTPGGCTWREPKFVRRQELLESPVGLCDKNGALVVAVEVTW